MTIPPARTGRVFMADPDWSSNVRMTLGYRTQVIRSAEGNEMRDALRVRPREVYSVPVSEIGLSAERFLADAMGSSLDATFDMGLSWRSVALDQNAAQGDSTIEVATPHPVWLVAGQRLLFASEPMEAATVSNVSGTTITLSSALSDAHPAGSRVHLARTVWFSTDQQIRRPTDSIMTGNIEAEMVPGTGATAVEALSPPTFEGDDVFFIHPDWRDLPQLILTSTRDRMDSGRGEASIRNPADFPEFGLRYSTVMFDRDSLTDLVSIFDRLRGRRGCFRMPTWQSHLAAPAGTSQGSTSITFAGEDVALMSGNRVLNVVYHEWPDGSYQFNRVSGLTASSGSTNASMVDPWSAPIPAGGRLSWAPLWRFQADSLLVELLSDSLSRARINLVALPKDAP